MLALIDGNALVHRAFHALPPLTTPRGELVNAVYGVATMLLKVLEEMRPEYAAAAFDTAEPTFRHREFEGYKAQRAPAPEGLHEQFGRVHELLDCLGIPIFRVDGYEADDLLGTLSRQAADQGLDVVIVTGDTDALQLVGPRVSVLTSRKGFTDTVLYDEQAVRDRYGVEPWQLVDVKALMGDVSDNIPGVPGVGEKTACRLISQFGDLETLYASLDRLPERQRRLLSEHRDQAFFSQRLARIVTNVPVRLDLESCRLGRFDRSRLIALFRELGFKSLVDRIPKEWSDRQNAGAEEGSLPEGQLVLFEPDSVMVGRMAEVEGVAEAARSVGEQSKSVTYRVVDDEESLRALVEVLSGADWFAFDLETTGLDAMRADLVGLSFAAMPGVAYYVPVGHLPPAARGLDLLSTEAGERDDGEQFRQLPLSLVLETLKPILEDERRAKCAHNGKYDMLVLARYGVEVRGMKFDTMVAAYLLEGTQRSLGLKDLAWSRLSVEMESYQSLAGKGKNAVTFDRLPIGRVARYACADADMTLRLMRSLQPELESTGLEPLFMQVEMPLVPVLVDMERTGVALDVGYLKEFSRELYQRERELETAICAAVGHSFNLASTQQLATVLFKELKLSPTRKTKTGYSTDADVLEELRGTHEVVEMILEHRQISKLKSTYVDALPLLVNPRTGRVHTSFNQTATATGRLSSSDPNLQNIPIRTELGRRVRKAFVAERDGWTLLSADYSQIELRVLAHMTGDPTLVEAFRRGEDIHAATAATVYGIPLSEVTANERRIAKTVNFGVLYGMSDYGLARDTGLTRQQAAEFIESYFKRYSSVAGFFEKVKQDAAEKGYVSTLLGRRRYIPEIRATHKGLRQQAERMAINMPIQGTAADIIKIAMINLHHLIRERGWRSRMILQVHDELLFECPMAELELLAPEVKRIMESAMPLQVPLVVDLKVGHNWDEMGRYPL